ncbi:MAG: hypothetical protein H0X28_10615 [Solirubrobacterales bacterium]|nr:hypothetical protein [Solirubrobacterales bacterium]
MADSIEQLSFELSLNALAEQERTLISLRGCAGTVLGAASIASSFMGAKASGGSFDVWAISATVWFVLCVVSAIWVLLPHELTFACRGERLFFASSNRRPVDVTEAYLAGGAWIESFVRANASKLAELAAWLTLSCLLLAAEVVFWTISLVR